jgi:hypothetical protein
MKKYILISIVSLLLGIGFGFKLPHGAQLGGGAKLDQHFVYGLFAGQTDQFAVTSTGTISSTANVTAASYGSATIGSSSTSPFALGSAIAGHITVGTTTPATRVAIASSTAVTANSSIILQQETTTPIAGTTCNGTAATSTLVTSKIAGSGFVVTSGSIPATNPECYAFWIIN